MSTLNGPAVALTAIIGALFAAFTLTDVVLIGLLLLSNKKDELLLNNLYAYNISTQQWMNLKTRCDIPTSRDRHSLTIIDNRIFIFGGSSSSSSTNSNNNNNDGEFLWTTTTTIATLK